MRRREGRELAIVTAFVALAAAPWLSKPFHMDEPFFLAIARHILQDPLHPLDFMFNWYGRAVPMASINNTPSLPLFILAAALKATGGGELPMRLLFLPVEILAALSLYLLAARFLKEPLWPVLIALASPGYLINMSLLNPEKLCAAFGFMGLYALVRGIDDKSSRWYWTSAVLLAAALLSKYAGVLFLLPAAGYALERRVRPPRILAHLALACSGLAAYFAWDRLAGGAAAGAVWQVTSDSWMLPWANPPHKLRSILSFVGGCGVVTAAWPFLAWRAPRRRLAAAAALIAVLFWPGFDLGPVVRPIDRLSGGLLAFGTLLGLWGLFLGGKRGRGWPLWAPWALSVLLVLLCLYWSVLARITAFLIPPLVFALAEALESRLAAPERRRLYAASLAATAAVTLALAVVDYRYAWVQKEVAARVAREHPGRRLWCAGHWGLQYYLEAQGARELDWSRGGWSQVRPGDVVVVPRVNSNVLRPDGRVLAKVSRLTIPGPLPVRLISGWTGEGGFYSNITGFLPFSLSTEPLDEFDIVEAL